MLKSIFSGEQVVYTGEVIETSPLKIVVNGTTVEQGVRKSEACTVLEKGDEVIVVRNAQSFVIMGRVK